MSQGYAKLPRVSPSCMFGFMDYRTSMQDISDNSLGKNLSSIAVWVAVHLICGSGAIHLPRQAYVHIVILPYASNMVI